MLGTVQSLTLAPDHTHVLVKVATTRQAEPLLTEQTIFWVVKPRLFAGNVSGLDTLLSGSYVELPQAEGKQQLEFTGREDPPIIEANVPATTFLLQAKPSPDRYRSARRYTTVTSPSARCSAGTSATWPRA